MDLFAVSLNRKVPRFLSKFKDVTVERIDAVYHDQLPGLLYTFPSTPLLSKVLYRMHKEKVEVILMVPL